MNILAVIIDLILVLIFASFIINGRRRGFVNAILTLIATVISIFTAYEFSAPVAQWADETFIKNAAVNSIADIISANIGNGTQAVVDAIPSYIAEAAKAGGISLSEIIAELGSSVDAVQVAEQIYGAAHNAVVMPVLTVITFLVVYAAISFVLSFAVRAISKVFRLPILKGLNKLFGGLLGAFKGAVAIVILCTVLVAIKFILPEEFALAVDESVIVNFAADIILK